MAMVTLEADCSGEELKSLSRSFDKKLGVEMWLRGTWVRGLRTSGRLLWWARVMISATQEARLLPAAG